ncbi:hypothetical protein BpHYR1_044770 [Brachionus plicatilis]|uniref:Uncharacterized protein n=1 Tax=Brachionus plicatilis TaxID=10195 RepID=A0A3M7R7Z1_BRAPC|nr:hypothetical protein BpHYR1_044770 [Brachionus plicatilis]
MLNKQEWNLSYSPCLIYVTKVFCFWKSNSKFKSITFWENVSHAQIARCQTYHRRLVQLGSDGAWQRQQTRQLVELGVLFFSSSASSYCGD